MSQTILLIGAGKIGRMIASLLTRSGDYQLRIADRVPAGSWNEYSNAFPPQRRAC